MKRLALSLCLVAMICASGCLVVVDDEEDYDEYRDDFSGSIIIEVDFSLHLEGYNGQITLTGIRDSRTATFTYEKKARAGSEQEAKELFEGIEIDEEKDSGTRQQFVRIRSDHPEKTSVDVRGEVPSDVPIHIVTNNGTVILDRIDRPVTINLDNGAVKVTGITDDVNAVVQNGTIEVDMAGFNGDDVVNLRTTNGSVSLRIPTSASVTVKARTDIGTVTTQGLTFVQKTIEKTVTGATLDAQLGAGNGTIDLRTNTGTILVRGW